VPGDGLALAVRVSRQIQGIGLLQQLGDGLNVLLVAVDDLVLHLEAVLRVHGAFLRHQVAHMAIGGDDLEIGSEILLDGLGLGGGFDDDEIHGPGADNRYYPSDWPVHRARSAPRRSRCWKTPPPIARFPVGPDPRVGSTPHPCSFRTDRSGHRPCFRTCTNLGVTLGLLWNRLQPARGDRSGRDTAKQFSARQSPVAVCGSAAPAQAIATARV
jgi:hypothetical protein